MTLGGDDLSAAEAEIYDRQLRLWGIEAQRRMQNSRVLVTGLTTIGAEVVKNLVLAGMNVTIQDDKLVEESDLRNHFLLSEQDLGKNRARAAFPNIQDLNPLTTVECWEDSLENIMDEQWKSFQVVTLTSASKSLQVCASLSPLFE